MFQEDTIAAISTGMSSGGIGKIRVSGPDAVAIVDKIFRSPDGKKNLADMPSHTIHYGHIYADGHVIDEVLVLLMRAPRTYTREDVVEIDCHGGIVVMKRLLETVIAHGARPAEPGEFTKRAFLNGRIDLSQAEAVIDVINARSTMALDTSLRQLKGSVSRKIRALREEIIRHIAFIEAAMDDPEHYQTDTFSEELSHQVLAYIAQIDHLLAQADSGRMLREGIKTVILGRPNAGKSSLMNALLGEDRAIVTDIAGTTRDTLEEQMTIGGIPLKIIDTAGIRRTDDVVEKIGVEKAVKSLEDADLVIYVVDRSMPLDQNDEDIMAMTKDRQMIVLLNKSDLVSCVDAQMIAEKVSAPVLEVSAKDETGIELVAETIKGMFFRGDLEYNEEVYITSVRQKDAMIRARESLKMVLSSIEDGMPEDFFSIDLMEAYAQLGYILGEAVEDDLVDKIFSEFCMGK